MPHQTETTERSQRPQLGESGRAAFGIRLGWRERPEWVDSRLSAFGSDRSEADLASCGDADTLGHMSAKTYSSELERALARPDADQMRQQLLAFAEYNAEGAGDWPDELAGDFGEIIACHFDDPEKAFAYVILAASQSDDHEFLALMGCANLENVLHDPSDGLLERIVAEARRSARFRWLLSWPYKVAIAAKAWEAIEKFRITGPHEAPSDDKLPSRG